MAKLRFTDRFIDDATVINSARLHEHLVKVLSMLEAFPESGSSDVPDSIRDEFGADIRDCALNPFDLVYEYDRERDIVLLYGLIHQRLAR